MKVIVLVDVFRRVITYLWDFILYVCINIEGHITVLILINWEILENYHFWLFEKIIGEISLTDIIVLLEVVRDFNLLSDFSVLCWEVEIKEDEQIDRIFY